MSYSTLILEKYIFMMQGCTLTAAYATVVSSVRLSFVTTVALVWMTMLGNPHKKKHLFIPINIALALKTLFSNWISRANVVFPRASVVLADSRACASVDFSIPINIALAPSVLAWKTLFSNWISHANVVFPRVSVVLADVALVHRSILGKVQPCKYDEK